MLKKRVYLVGSRLGFSACMVSFAPAKSALCPGGEIGRHRGLKIPRSLRSCRFKSGPGHHSNINKNMKRS